MIVLDSNVISELTRPRPDPRVLTWFAGTPARQLATTAITVGEVLSGVALLPDGRRKTELRNAVESVIYRDLRGHAEPFDLDAAAAYSEIVAVRSRLGRPISVADAQIAAICRATDAVLASRNTADFEHTGIQVVNPWQAPRR